MSEHYFRVAVLGNKNATPVSSRYDTLPGATVRGRTMQAMPRYRQRILVVKEYARRHSGCVGVAIHDIEQGAGSAAATRSHQRTADCPGAARRAAADQRGRRANPAGGLVRDAPRLRVMTAALVAARGAAGVTQRELAARLGRAHSFIAKIEGGSQELKVLEFCEYAAALGVDPCSLLRQVVESVIHG